MIIRVTKKKEYPLITAKTEEMCVYARWRQDKSFNILKYMISNSHLKRYALNLTNVKRQIHYYMII